MKHNLSLLGMFGITMLVTTSFTSDFKKDEPQEQKTVRHIKMMKVEDGKKTELDTIVNNNLPFVWKGDTIGGKEMFRHRDQFGPEQMKHIRVIMDKDGEDEDIVVLRSKDGEPAIWNMDSGEEMELVTEDIDSLGKRIVIRKSLKDGKKPHMVFMNGHKMMPMPPVPPMPPMPPMPHFERTGGENQGRLIDLNDPNIISYSKKTMSGGREKIEIIRKKSEEVENLRVLEIEQSNQLMPPPPPPPLPEGDDQ